MNLLMMAPLLDSRGQVRYFIGAQIDVSGLVEDCTDLEAFRHMLDQKDGHKPEGEPKDEFQQLAEMFNHTELDTVRKFGGNMHREHVDEHDNASLRSYQPRLLIQDQTTFDMDKSEKPSPKPDGKLSGAYKHVSLIVRFSFFYQSVSSISKNNQKKKLTISKVSSHPTCAISPHPLLLPVSPRPRDPAIALPRPHWRRQQRPRLSGQSPLRRLTRRDSQDPMAAPRRFESRELE